MISVAILERISIDTENFENQDSVLRRFCAEKEWNIVKVYKELEHGQYGVERRDVLRQIFVDAANDEFDILLVWKMDRITRGGAYDHIGYIKKFNALGVSIWSYNEGEQRVDTAEEEAMAALRAYGGRKYREDVVKNIKNAFDRMKREIKQKGYTIGKRGQTIKALGKPMLVIGKSGYPKRELTEADARRIIDMHSKGASLRTIAKRFECSITPIRKIVNGEYYISEIKDK